jgi:hypothetical protein
MEKETLDYINECFAELVRKFGFRKVDEFNDGQQFWIEFRSDVFGIRLEKYRQELYPTLYKIGFPEDEINLFNLLRFLNVHSSGFEYSRRDIIGKEELNAYYREQVEEISTAIYKSFAAISVFFARDDFKLEVAKLREFMIDKYPELFGKAQD